MEVGGGIIKKYLELLINEVCDKQLNTGEKVATIGFDGFVDSIVRVVKNDSFFTNIKEFGGYIAAKHDKSCSLEIKQSTLKMGGNAPILSNALGTLGVSVHCLGALGYPDIHTAFSSMSGKCTLHTLAQPGLTTALEFNDGKIMLAHMEPVSEINWSRVKEAVGLDDIIKFISESSLIGIVNWSELKGATSIWEGMLKEVIPLLEIGKEKIFLFDLSDCSNRDSGSIIYALELMQEFSRCGKVLLSINVNELNVLHKVLCGSNATDDLIKTGSELKKKLNIDILAIHHTKCSIAIEGDTIYKADTIYINEPKLSTGGGDNFNAGLSMGQLMGLGTELSLYLGNAVAAYYIQNGFSPELTELIEFLKAIIIKEEII